MNLYTPSIHIFESRVCDALGIDTAKVVSVEINMTAGQEPYVKVVFHAWALGYETEDLVDVIRLYKIVEKGNVE